MVAGSSPAGGVFLCQTWEAHSRRKNGLVFRLQAALAQLVRA